MRLKCDRNFSFLTGLHIQKILIFSIVNRLPFCSVLLNLLVSFSFVAMNNKYSALIGWRFCDVIIWWRSIWRHHNHDVIIILWHDLTWRHVAKDMHSNETVNKPRIHNKNILFYQTVRTFKLWPKAIEKYLRMSNRINF